MADNINKLITRQFALARQGMQGERRRALEASQQATDRFAAINRLQGSGALLKAQQNQQQELNQQFAEQDAGLGAQEAGAKAQAGLAQEQLKEQRRQFNLEFDINKRNNIINTALALRESDLINPRKWVDLVNTLGAFGYKELPGVSIGGRGGEQFFLGGKQVSLGRRQ